ncbi:PaaI family thioesterase [Ferrimonas sediminicola]|uniref:PaaI family thioesterase n=1 Tax=Ferrimonas sediminicola TaxID=2569538 RepID=A0A4U1BB25_9GAMM|nr:PaaI family thioesterase [Ferrimonas sediminicola]TKB47759.1 PaaI family thioesterase [Ferrimonas sediminicola]
MSAQTMSGLEVMSAIATGKLPHPNMAETITMRVVSVNQGGVVFEARADERHTNPLGGVHGGFAATVLDSVTGCAVHTMLEPGQGYGTIELNVKMLRPVPKAARLRAEGQVVSMTRSLGVAEGRLLDEKGRLLAMASATCMLKIQGD